MWFLRSAFSQLAADNQFASLGIFLLTVLAEIHSAIAPLARPAVDSNLASQEQPTAKLIEDFQKPTLAAHLHVDTDADLGVPVPRPVAPNRFLGGLANRQNGKKTSAIKPRGRGGS